MIISGWVIIIIISISDLLVPALTVGGEATLAIIDSMPDLTIRGPSFATEDECLQYNQEVIVPMDTSGPLGRTVKGRCEKEE